MKLELWKKLRFIGKIKGIWKCYWTERYFEKKAKLPIYGKT